MKGKVLLPGVVVLLLTLAAGICCADAASDIARCDSLYKAGSYDRAFTSYQKILTDYPGTDAAAEATLRMGEIYHVQEEYDQAVQQFANVAESTAKYALRAKFWIGYCYQVQEKYTEAISAFKAGVADIPAEISKENYYVKYTNYRLGECYKAIADWDSAITLYTALAEDYPEDAPNHKLDLATCYVGKKDYEKAIALCNTVAHSYPSMAGVALLKVDDYLGEQKKVDERLAYLDQLYSEHPELRENVLMRRSIVKSDEKKQFNEAIADLEQLLADYPESESIMHAKARIAGITLHGLNDVIQARLLLRVFEEQHPDYDQMAFIRGDLGTCAYKEQNYLEAARLFEATLQYEDPSNYHCLTLYMIGDCYERAGDIDKAIKVWNKLRTEHSTDPWAVLATQAVYELTER